MPDSEMDQLAALCNTVKAVDKSKLMRPELGTLSLSPQLEGLFNGFIPKLDLAVEVVDMLPENMVRNFRINLQSCFDTMTEQGRRSNADYATNRADVLRSITSQMNQVLQDWPHFVSAAIERKGLLRSDAAFQQNMSSANELASKIVEEAKKYADALQEKAKTIEAGARSTAQGVSFAEVQKEFHSAQSNLFRKVLLWGVLSSLAFSGFILFAWYIVQHPPLLAAMQPALRSDHVDAGSKPSGESPVWLAIYLAAIRITILTAIGAATTFFLRMFRAHLHMNEFNLHRQRVVNSLPVLVQAAETPEQRDQIRGRLIDLVTGFGNSGLLNTEDDSFSAPKMTIEAVMKNLSGDK
jgi:hypothetical protein